MSPLLAFVSIVKGILDFRTAKLKRENLKLVRKLHRDLRAAQAAGNLTHINEIQKQLIEIDEGGF